MNTVGKILYRFYNFGFWLGMSLITIPIVFDLLKFGVVNWSDLAIYPKGMIVQSLGVISIILWGVGERAIDRWTR